MNRHLLTYAMIALAALLGACGGGKPPDDAAAPETFPSVTRHASLLAIRPLGHGAALVDVANPWDTSGLLASYLLIDRATAAMPDSVPPRQRLDTLRVPLSRSAVFSSVHGGAIEELGAAGSIGSVADAGYFKSPALRRMIDAGEITDLGSGQAPSPERIAIAAPDAMLVSPMRNAGHGVLETTGTTLVEMADYMEPTPLGRAEWLRFIGLLYGRGAEADSVFTAVETAYNAIAAKAAAIEKRPKVLTEMLTGGYWFVPGGRSYMARLITDAGGEYPWSADKSAGSLQLDFSAVYARAADADVWLIRVYDQDLTLRALREVYPLNSQIKAFKTGGVYAANTAAVPLFDEFPFHPELLLEEYYLIFSGQDPPYRYYAPAR